MEESEDTGLDGRKIEAGDAWERSKRTRFRAPLAAIVKDIGLERSDRLHT